MELSLFPSLSHLTAPVVTGEASVAPGQHLFAGIWRTVTVPLPPLLPAVSTETMQSPRVRETHSLLFSSSCCPIFLLPFREILIEGVSSL